MKSKLVKRCVIVALSFCLVFSCLSLTACAPDPQKTIIGFWISDTEKSWYEFHEDGTCRHDGTAVELSTTTWKYDSTYINELTKNKYYYYNLGDSDDRIEYDVSKQKIDQRYIKTKYKTYEEWSKATGKTVA